MPRTLPYAAVVLVVLVAGGCASGGEGSPVVGHDLVGQTVEVAATWSGTEQRNFQAVLDAFHLRTGATVRYTSGGNDLAVLLNSRLAGGAPPDVALIPQPGVVAQLAARGALIPLSGVALAAVQANYSEVWQRLGRFDGRQYGFYFKAANKSLIWYRTDDFADAGVGPPATWGDLVRVSRMLADAGHVPMVVTAGDGWVLTDWFENVYVRLAGARDYAKLARHEIAWTDPTVVATLRLLQQYWTQPGFIENGPAGALQVSFTQGIADVFGSAPAASMLFEGDFVAAEIDKLGQVEVGRGARFFDFPSIDGSPPAVLTAGDQAVAMKDTPGAMALMAFLASPEAASIEAGKGGFISPNLNLALAAYPDPTSREAAAPVVDSALLLYDLSDQAPMSFGGSSAADMWVLLQNFLSRSLDPVVVAGQLETAATRDYGGGV
jgi:ABC-type glycerol-3-phosphate transport system substrate-binding protein